MVMSLFGKCDVKMGRWGLKKLSEDEELRGTIKGIEIRIDQLVNRKAVCWEKDYERQQ
jgi:hypothetical protein